MPQSLLFRDGEIAADDVDTGAPPPLAGPGTVLWAACDPASPAQLDTAARLTGVPRAKLDEILDPRRRDRIWQFEGRFALVAHALRPGADGTVIDRLAVLVSADAIVTCGDPRGFDVGAVLADAGELEPVARHGTGALLHRLLERLAAGYHEAALDIDNAMDGVEERLFSEDRTAIARVQRDTYLLRKRLVLLRRAVLPLREALDALPRPDPGGGQRWAQQHFSDLTRQLDRLEGLTDSLREMLASILSTNLSIQQARLNVTMKKLTGWAAVIAVPTFMTSWYGMNVWLPGQHALWGALLANGLLAVAAVVVYVSFRRRDWL